MRWGVVWWGVYICGEVRVNGPCSGLLISILSTPLHSHLCSHFSSASCCTEHTVRLWDAASGKSTADLTGHTASVLAVAYAPDGKPQ